jgi:hypothetical protein
VVNTIRGDEPVVDPTESVALAQPRVSAESPPGGVRGITSQGDPRQGYHIEPDQVQPRPAPSELNFAVGVPYFLPFTTAFENAWEVYRDDIVTIRQLNAMRREDGQARALYRLLTMPIRAALKDASFQPRGDDPETGQAEARFISDMFMLPPSLGGMTSSFSHFIGQMLLAIFEGFAAFEQVYWSPRTGPLKGKWTLRKLDWRPAETLTFLLDSAGEFDGLRQRTFFQGRTIDVRIKGENVVYFACNEEERPFYGVSMFETAFFHYDKKVKLYYISHLAAQRAAVGTRVGTMPANALKNDRLEFINALKQLGLAQYIALPNPEYAVTNLKEEGNFDFLGLINHHNSQMSKSVLQAWFDEVQGTGGDTTLVDFGKQSDATAMMLLESIMADIAAVINDKIIPKFIDWNFGSDNYPEFHWGPLTEEQKAAIQTTFDTLAAAGQNLAVSQEFMLELEKRMAAEFGFTDIDYDKISEQRQQDADQQRQQKQAESQFMMQNLAAQQQGGAPAQQPLPAQGGAGSNPSTATGGPRGPSGRQVSSQGSAVGSSGAQSTALSGLTREAESILHGLLFPE